MMHKIKERQHKRAKKSVQKTKIFCQIESHALQITVNLQFIEFSKKEP